MTGRAFGLAAVVLVPGLAAAAASGPGVLFGLAGLPFTMVALLLSRRDASRTCAAVARRPRDG